MTRTDVTSSTTSSTMCSRAEDSSMTPSQRKRPLSIIEEHDSSDDAVLPETSGDFGARTKENKPPFVAPKESPIPEHDSPKHPGKCVNFAIVDEGPIKMNKPKSNSSKNKPKGSSDTGAKLTQSAKSKIIQSISTSSGTDIKTPGWKKKKQKSSRKNSVNPSVSDPSSKAFQDKPNHSDENTATKPPRSRKKSQDNSALLKNSIINGSSQISKELKASENSPPCSKVVSDGLARIRETVERLNLTTSTPIAPPLVTLTPSPKLNQRFKFSPTLTTRQISDANALAGEAMPKITITSTSGMVRRSSDDDPSSDVAEVQTNGTVAGVSPKLPSRASYLTSKYSSTKYGSSYFTRRVRNDSLSEGELSEDPSESFGDVMLGSDLKRLQETTEKLHLSARRPSIMQWRQKYVENPEPPTPGTFINGTNGDEELTVDRKHRINAALDWLRNELQEMRSQDQTLARQLLTIRQDLHKLKLRRCTEQHQDLIDDYQSELEDLHEFSYVLDLPQPVYGNNPLKHIGVTRLNLSARRFSAC